MKQLFNFLIKQEKKMKLKNLFKVLFTLGVFTLLVNSTAFAQTYVSNTNGNDVAGDGQDVGVGIPYATIAKGITMTASGGTIIIDADTYGEAQVNVTKELTFVSRVTGALDVVTITNGVIINPGAAKTVNLGTSASGSVKFNLGTTAGALELTSGSLNITTANVIIGNGATIKRTAGAINEAPTFTTNVNVTYLSTVDIAAGAELPANIGTGLLTVNITAAKTATFANALTTTGGVTVTTGNATFNGNLAMSTSNFTNTPAGNTVAVNGTVSLTTGKITNSNTGGLTVNGNVTWTLGANITANAVDNTGNGNVTFNGTVAFNKGSTGTGHYTGLINNGGTGTVKFEQGFTVTSATVSAVVYTPQISATNAAGGELIFNGAAQVYDLTNNTGKITFTGGKVVNTVANNTAAGTVELKANMEFAGATLGNGHATAVIKLNTYTLTFSNAGFTYTNTGNMISATAATVGSGVLNVTGTGSVTTTGQLPNVTVTGSGKLTIPNATVPVYGTFSLASPTAGALTFNAGGGGIDVYGSGFTRSDNTPNNVSAGNGTVAFRGGTAQTFAPGASLTIYNLTVNKSASAVTLGASVNVSNNLTITAGGLDIGNYNLNMTGNGTFSNGGAAYSTSGLGYVVFMSADDGGGVGIAGTAGTITGAGTFSNILVNLGDPADRVATGSSIAFSGTLYLYQGQLRIADGHTITFNNTSVANPTVKIITTATTKAGLTQVGGAGTGTVAYSANVNLEYLGASSYNVNTIIPQGADVGGLEWIKQPTKLNNVSINVDNTLIVTGYAGASTIAGVLTVGAGTRTLAQGAHTYTLSGAVTHSIKGKVTGGTLLVTGAGSTITGFAATGDAAEVNNLEIAVGAANSFTSTNLKKVAGTFVHTSGGNSSVTMNSTAAEITGNVTMTAGTLNLNMNSTTSTMGGNLVVTDGSMTLTRGAAAQQNIAGTVTLTAGTLTLGSSINVTGATGQAAGNLALSSFNYTAIGAYTHTGAGTITGTGKLIVKPAGAADFTLTTALSVPNIEIDGGGVVSLKTNNLTVSNSFTLTAGGFDLDGNQLIITGNTVNLKTGIAFNSTTGAGVIELQGAATVVKALTGNFTFATAANLAEVKVNSTGTVTFETDDLATPTYRTFTVVKLTQTAGDIGLGGNTLILTGGATTFTRTAGIWTMGTGKLVFNNGAFTFDPGTGWAVDNLEVQANASPTAAQAFTVNKKLTLAGGTLTTSADGKLSLAANATVERQLNSAKLFKVPTFPASGSEISVIYNQADNTGNASITTDKELPATVKDLTINNQDVTAAEDDVVLNANLTVTGTLYLTDGEFDEGTEALTLASGATLNRTANGAFKAASVPTVTSYNLVYSGAGNITTAAEDFLAGLSNFSIQTTGGADVTLGSSRAITGNFTLNAAGAGAEFDFAAFNFSVAGNVTYTAGALVNKGGTTSQFSFNGSAAQTLTVPAAGYTFSSAATAAGLEFVLNNSSTDGVTLTGGDLTIDDTDRDALVRFTKGVLKTGSNVLTLWHKGFAGSPVQGFVRSVAGSDYSHVVGNVRKNMDVVTEVAGNTPAIRLTRVEYPVGTAPTSPGYYRPLAIYFNTLPTASFNLTVNHVEASPAGTNGFPLTSGSLTITNYPGFYWLISSDLTLQPQVKYDIEARAAGYTDYLTDGVQNVRFIRRYDNHVDNPWIVQGGLSYDNSTDGTTPVIIVRGAEGAISEQGARFTYSQLNKPPVLSSPANISVNEGTTATVTWTATDPDISQTATMSIVSKPAAATFSAGVLTWVTTFFDAGVYTAIVQATDGVLTSKDTVQITVTNVNRPPSFTVAGAQKLADTTIKSNQVLTFTYLAIDPDTDAPAQTYSGTVAAPAPTGVWSINPATGVFTFTPVFADAGKVFAFTVTATDASSETATTTANVTVTYPRLKGDVNNDNAVNEGDAIRILRHVVNLTGYAITDPVDEWAALVGPGGSNAAAPIIALNAARILFYAANFQTWPVWKMGAVNGTVAWGELKYNSDIVTIPVKITEAANVLSATVSLKLDNSLASLENVSSSLPEGWLIAHNLMEDGRLSIALAGTKPLSDGDFVNITLKLLNKEAKISLEGSVALNDQLTSMLKSLSVSQVPTQFGLSQNYPNPFNPTTKIQYQLPQNSKVSLVIYDMLGQSVKTLISSEHEAGYYTVEWNGLSDNGTYVASGLYIYRLKAGSYVATQKMNFVK